MQRNPWLKLVIYALHAVHWSLVMTPLFCWLNLLALAIHAYSILGHWPRPSLDDPKDITGIQLHSDFVSAMNNHCFYTIPIVLIMSVAMKYLDGQTLQRYRLISLLAIWALFISLLVVDPGRIFYWYMD